MVIKHVSYIDQ